MICEGVVTTRNLDSLLVVREVALGWRIACKQSGPVNIIDVRECGVLDDAKSCRQVAY